MSVEVRERWRKEEERPNQGLVACEGLKIGEIGDSDDEGEAVPRTVRGDVREFLGERAAMGG